MRYPSIQDLAKPATIQVGLALETVARTVHIALLPLKALCWGADQFSSFLEGKVAEKLRNVSPENIKTPQADIAIPLLESVRLKEHSAPLVDLYAQLLASAMQKRADGQEVHPAFVEVLKQCSPDDASILNILYLKLATPFLLVEITSTDGLRTTLEKRFTTLAKESGVENLRRVRIAIDNLTRLGLVDAIEGSTMPDDSLYDDLETLAVGDSELGATKDRAIPVEQLQFTRGAIVLRDFGLEFCRACMDEVGLEQRVSLRVKGPEMASESPTAPYLMIIIPQITPLRVSGLTELVGDIRLRVVGQLRHDEKITIKFFLNTIITSRLEKDPWSEAAIYVGRERVKLAQGRQIGANALLFENVDLQLIADLPISERFLTISGVRCNANQIGFGNMRIEPSSKSLAWRFDR